MNFLATTTGEAATTLVAPTDLGWASFAPELVVSTTVMVLLLLAVAGRWRPAIGVLSGLATMAVGVLLAIGQQELQIDGSVGTDGDVFLGGTIVALGIMFVALPVGFATLPRLANTSVAVSGTLAALVLTFWQRNALLEEAVAGIEPALTGVGSVAYDGVAVVTRTTVLIATGLILAMSSGYLKDRRIARVEFEPLVLLAATGMMLLGAAADLITMFVALEILSIALYVLAGLARRDRRSQESAIKYFVTGAVASAILLYGMALLYAATGSLELNVIALRLSLVETPVGMAGLSLALITVGVGFKIAAVPFHLWTPDVYQGAPTNVTAFMAAGTKAAAFAMMLRLYVGAFDALSSLWLPLLTLGAAATMIYGAAAALVQVDVKRILAYSSVAHAGYALIGVIAGEGQGVTSTTWYLLTYAVSTVAAFGVVLEVERRREGEVTLATIRGLGRSSPTLAGMLGIAMLSLAGIPPTIGFAGKLAVFRAGVNAGFTWLVVIGVISSVIAAFFYLRIIGAMYLDEPEEDAVVPPAADEIGIALWLAATAVAVLGVAPDVLLEGVERVSLLAQ